MFFFVKFKEKKIKINVFAHKSLKTLKKHTQQRAGQQGVKNP